MQQFITFRPTRNKSAITRRARGNVSRYLNRLIDADFASGGPDPDWDAHFARLAAKKHAYSFAGIKREER